MYQAALWSSTIARVPTGLSQCSSALFALALLAPPAEPVAVVFASCDPIFIAVGSLAHPAMSRAPDNRHSGAAIFIELSLVGLMRRSSGRRSLPRTGFSRRVSAKAVVRS